MSEGGSTASVRSLSASAFWPKTLISGFVFVVCALALYSAYAWWTLSRVKDQTLELDILKGESAGKDSQLLALGERLEDMGRSLESLKERERDLALLTREFNKTLGLPDSATLEEVWPALTSTVAWTWGGESQGGVAPDADRRTEFKSPAEVIKTLHDDLDRLERNAAGVDMALSELTSALEGSKSLLAATPMLIPVPKGRFTSGFGYRASPFGGGSDLHLGVDLAAPIGTAVYAPADGVVLSSDWSSSGYGQMITIDHGYGLTTRYAHLSESLVKAGEAVARGELIAKVGNSGRSTGPHLHFETIMGGVHVDPLIFSGAAQAKKAADAKISNRSKGGVKGEAKPKADANGDVKDAAKSEPKPKPKPKPKADANGEAKDAASSEVKPKPKPKPKADASGEAKDAASSEPKPKPKPKPYAYGDA
jgi:murein DD-endopeptidase MepM/ murein hydrolase activator NlpD